MVASGKIDPLAGFETVADPVSVKSDSSSASFSLTRVLDLALVFTQRGLPHFALPLLLVSTNQPPQGEAGW